MEGGSCPEAEAEVIVKTRGKWHNIHLGVSVRAYLCVYACVCICVFERAVHGVRAACFSAVILSNAQEFVRYSVLSLTRTLARLCLPVWPEQISQETAIGERAHLEQRVEDLQTTIYTVRTFRHFVPHSLSSSAPASPSQPMGALEMKSFFIAKYLESSSEMPNGFFHQPISSLIKALGYILASTLNEVKLGKLPLPYQQPKEWVILGQISVARAKTR